MYELIDNSFGDFGNDTVILDMNKPVTFTYDGHKLFNFSSDSTIQTALQNDLAPYANVVSVSRSLFSNRYAITLIPKQSMSPNTWQYLIKNSLAIAGFPNASFIAMEGGTTSSVSGGVKEVVTTTSKKVGTDIIQPLVQGVVTVGESALKPLVPYLILGGVGIGAYLWYQYKMVMGKR